MKKNVAAITIIIALVLAGFGTWYFLNFQYTRSETPDSIIVGCPPLEQSTLIYIAEDQDFFTRNGLNVTIMNDYPNGVVPINDMLNDKLDISVSAEYPVVTQAFNRENISIIGSIDKYQNEKIVGRKDRGINNIPDLKGKKIGVPKKTICEFFLGRFLDLHGMSLQDVILVDTPTSKAVDAIANGDVDAIIYYQPYIYAIENKLGDNGISWQAQSDQLVYGVMASRNDWIASHPEAMNRFFKSLDQAEEYTITHPAEAKAIVQKKLNLSDAYMTTIWPVHQFSLSLDQSMILSMRDEAHWIINNNLTSEKTIPNFKDYIYIKSLHEVKPESVNIR
jgi:ABC-type nitrate/sulfonate/bicarbonate transport system substrate-binding protein